LPVQVQGPATRIGAVAFIHRFGSTLNPQLHFHCVVIDGVFESDPAGGVIFRLAADGVPTSIVGVSARTGTVVGCLLVEHEFDSCSTCEDRKLDPPCFAGIARPALAKVGAFEEIVP
jgi:Putative transposase